MDVLPETGEEVILGTVNFNLNRIEKQEEYDIILDILDEESDSKINATINCKILFIWSHYKYYYDLYLKSESVAQSYKNVLEKSTTFLENLNGK